MWPYRLTFLFNFVNVRELLYDVKIKVSLLYYQWGFIIHIKAHTFTMRLLNHMAIEDVPLTFANVTTLLNDFQTA